MKNKWILFSYSIPATNAKARMRTWRRISATGAAQLKTGLQILPNREDLLENITWLIGEVNSLGGEPFKKSDMPTLLMQDISIVGMFAGPDITSYAPPAGIDVNELAKIGLEFTGMSSEEAAAFVDTVDWTSTLVVPIPRNAAIYEQVEVDGVMGTLIQRPADEAPQFALIWVKDGIIYGLSGTGTDTAPAFEIVKALK